MDEKYKWRILYKPPIEWLDDNNVDTWRKVFLISKYDCPTELDFDVKIRELVQLYNMKEEFVYIEFLEEENE